VWLSWAENKNDPLARKLKAQHQALKIALQGAASRMRLAGDAATAQDVSNLLDFFGAAGSTSDALDTVKDLAEVRYCKPQDDPVQLEGTDVKVYVLGPPPDEKMIKKYNPSKREPETYGMDSMNTYLEAIQPTLSDFDIATPFDERFQIPLNMAQKMPIQKRRVRRGVASMAVGSTPPLHSRFSSIVQQTTRVLCWRLSLATVMY